jgi:hypothetical protein
MMRWGIKASFALVTLGIVGCGPTNSVPPPRVIVIENGRITRNLELDGTYETPRGGLEISGATLTLRPCTVLRMAPGSRIVVNNGGSIRALGTESCPVRIVSAKAVPAAGDWSQIVIEESASNDSLFQYTEIRHGDATFVVPPADGFLWVKSSVGLSHVRFAQIRGPVLKVEDGGRFSTFEAVNFDNVSGALAVVAANVVPSMTRVTVTNTENPRIEIYRWALVAHGPATWRNLGVPLVLPAGFEVRSGPIEIAAGTVLRVEANSLVRPTVKANGSIRALGTATEPVIFESANPAPAPGDWRGMTFETSSSADNLLRHVIIRHAGDNDYGVLQIEDRATLTVENITMEMNSSCEVKVDGMGVLNESGGRMLTRCM